ncbi:MAG: hypothetical protein A2808_03985 [Candidatus Moranbacteria bacterium RIFCSPHIGHO2_01_FULL_55_24]|nr:MAG: hypothetical protein A2808_03985 [Candidatus Moranbacteria bacterium RIFCSPHIGHO2_01_FULL_55_24]
MWRWIVFGLIFLGALELVAWQAWQFSQAPPSEERSSEETAAELPRESTLADSSREPEPEERQEPEETPQEASPMSYPIITLEEKNGRTERTIHMGVRQWAWEPSTIRAKQGELVRLVIHNADVRHPLVIPDLGLEADVPPEGAVVEFVASRKGTFDFLCGAYCGVGHAEMQGHLIVD